MNTIIMPFIVGRTMTRRCLDSLLAQDIGDVRVVAVSNGSNDGTLEYVRAYFQAIEIVAYASIRSLNKVWNDMIDLALIESDHVLVVNNDVVLKPETYRTLVEDGGAFVTGVSSGEEIARQVVDVGARSPHPDFSCFLMTRECWRRVGRFDEEFWAYCSDGDYHLRMHRAGIEAYCLALPFFHERSSTIRLADNATRDMLQVRADADRETFKRKWGFEMGSEEYERCFGRD